MFAGVSCDKKSGHHELYKFRLLCHNARMSTLCRAKWQLRNVRGPRPSRSLCGASRPALPVKDVFGGTPNTARVTHALPIHLSTFLNDPQGNRMEKINASNSCQSCHSRQISIILLYRYRWRVIPVEVVKPTRKTINSVNIEQILCKCFIMNNLPKNSLQPVIVSQSESNVAPVKLVGA